ncbi:MAG TPA: amidohydrolase family protein, partial [Bacillota bacterium]|nr:amidohydrolase family protein [Bacillota bacterium]
MECNGTVSMLLDSAAGLDVEYFCISSAATNPLHVRKGNDTILSLARDNKRFIPLCSFHPDATDTEKELEYIKENGAKGIKLHADFQKFVIDRPDIIHYYRLAAQLGLPILFHIGDENTDNTSPARLYNIIDKVPELKAIAAHMGGYKAWDEAENILYGTPVYMDTSDALVCLPPERVLAQIRRHGTKRIMFGSDYPLRSTRSAFEVFDKLPLTEQEKEQIYRLTALDLFISETK